MNELISNPVVIAPIVSVLGVVIVQVFAYFVLGKNLKVTDAEKYKTDLRADVEKLEKQVTEAYAKMGEWRERYYKEVETGLALKSENSDLTRAVKNLKAENDIFRAENKRLSDEVMRMKEDLQVVKKTASDLEKKVNKNAGK